MVERAVQVNARGRWLLWPAIGSCVAIAVAAEE
jgi:hypothetical protein